MSKERPIILKTHEVRAVLDGRKTMLRVKVKTKSSDVSNEVFHARWRYVGHSKDGVHEIPTPADVPRNHDRWYSWQKDNNNGLNWIMQCPFGEPGDILWVRETWQGFVRTSYEYDEARIAESFDYEVGENIEFVYLADGKNDPGVWRPSIHMPREACRLFLRIKSVRVERLQDISEEDAKAEGVADKHYEPEYEAKQYTLHAGIKNYRGGFARLWDSIYGSWNTNPWVWVVEFEQYQPEREGEG